MQRLVEVVQQGRCFPPTDISDRVTKNGHSRQR